MPDDDAAKAERERQQAAAEAAKEAKAEHERYLAAHPAEAAAEKRAQVRAEETPEAKSAREGFESRVLSAVAEFMFVVTGLRPPVERHLFPPRMEDALMALVDDLDEAMKGRPQPRSAPPPAQQEHPPGQAPRPGAR